MDIESKLLILFTRKYSSVVEINLKELEQVDWINFWKLCVCHKVVGIVYDNMKRNSVNFPGFFEKEAKKWIEETALVNRLQKQEYISLMEKINFPVIALKGIWLTNFLYKSESIRSSLDTDILFDVKNKNELCNILEKQGYVQGQYNREKNKIDIASRSTILYQEMYTHELYQYIKMVKERPIYIDCNFKFSWCGTKNYTPPEPTYQFLIKNSLVYKEKSFYCCSFNLELFFIHLCVHCYNEYHFFLYGDVPNYGELRLYRICDIRTLVQKMQLDWKVINRLVLEIDAKRQVDFCICLSNYIYLDDIFCDIEYEAFEVESINTYFDRVGKLCQWNISLYDRLFNIPLKIEETNKILCDNGLIS